ncbi:hypothetical protein PGT21_011838 [Puccinia graminis f. sp. tritici]|uniref:Uncharacterized protein n=1 Tax=Puccinia graminis f. sp. tritici TaxID=56615 RepID=A0A5B0SCX0_PUCGR|nr:hypothetical protein PGT21_011838 [Puccinia graminis f. sp. tritici]KAA1135991.1 hypothetical protein PGTUg99_017552 [Puccinia graminis f. sp. tritici]
MKPNHERNRIDAEDEQIGVGLSAVPTKKELDNKNRNDEGLPIADPISSPTFPLVSISFIGHNPMDVTKNPSQTDPVTNLPSSTNLDEISRYNPPVQPKVELDIIVQDRRTEKLIEEKMQASEDEPDYSD